MADRDIVKSLVDVALQKASGRADAAIARAVVYSGTQIRFSENAIDIANQWEEQNLDIAVVVDKKRIGVARVPVRGPDDVRKAVEQVLDFTRKLPESPLFNGLEDRPSTYGFSDGTVDPRYDSFIEDAPGVVSSAIDAAVQSGAKRVAGALKSERELVYMRSSLGPEGGYEQTRYDLNIRAFQKELDYSGQGLSCGTMPSQDEKLMIEAGRMAGSLSKESVGAVQGKPGTYDLVMSPTVAANVMASLPMSANPFMVLIGLSPLGDRLGQKLAPEFVTIDDNGRHPRGIGSRPFDFEGTPTQTTRIFDKGVFKSFIHNTSTAKMFDSVSTGNSSLVSLGQGSSMVLPDNTNVVFENGDHSLEELLEGSRPTIYVTCNWYTRWQNHLTGEFSTIPRDAMFLVEHGKKTPIKNIRLSDNILRMFANIVALGDDIRQVLWWEVPGPVFVPSIKVADCRITAATK